MQPVPETKLPSLEGLGVGSQAVLLALQNLGPLRVGDVFWFGGSFLVFLLPVGLCWREYIRKSYDMLVFAEFMTGNRLVLFRAVPNQTAVDGFVSVLQGAKQKAREIAQISSGQGSGMLSEELARLAVLRDRGVLSESEFQQAQTTLLGSAEGKRSIGFQT